MESRLVVSDLAIDTAARKVLRAGEPIALQPREYALLEYLARRTGQIVTRGEIEEHIYAGEVEPMSNAVDSAICALRRKLAESNPAPLIHTRRGLGYELAAE
jgi:DNA-binding response OmpR family regulator